MREGSASIHFERCSADRRRIIEPHRCVARPAPRSSLALALFLENFFLSLFFILQEEGACHWASHEAAFSEEQVIYFARQMGSSLSSHITLAGILRCLFWMGACSQYRDRLKWRYVVWRNLFLLLLTFSDWPCGDLPGQCLVESAYLLADIYLYGIT